MKGNLSEIIFLFFKTVERLLHYLRLVQIQTKDVFSPSHTREKNLMAALRKIAMDRIGVLRKYLQISDRMKRMSRTGVFVVLDVQKVLSNS